MTFMRINTSIPNNIFSLRKKMSHSRSELHTDRSILIESESNSPERDVEISKKMSSFYVEKLESHMMFMEKEFRQSMKWQKELLHELKKEKKNPVAPPKRSDSSTKLHLTKRQEQGLKEILKGYCQIHHDNLELTELIDLAINRKQSNLFKIMQAEKENDISFPIIPRVITMNDLAPSTQRHLDSSRASPIRLAQERVKVPKYRKVAKTPHVLFSPEPEEPLKISTKYQLCEEMLDSKLNPFLPQNQAPLQNSIQRRLLNQSNNHFTFNESPREQIRIKLSQNISLNFSSSHHDCPLEISKSRQQSILLISDEEDSKHNPSIYLKLYENKVQNEPNKDKPSQKQAEPRKSEVYLCFNNQKKMGRNKSRNANSPVKSPKTESDTRVKKLHDSFGKIYHEFQLEKETKEGSLKAERHSRMISDYT